MVSHPVSSADLTFINLLNTGILIALAASRDIPKEVLPKSSIHLRGKYSLMKSRKKTYT